eukprot:13302581-Alexandrium_andersonii.AAC.1
MRVDRVDRAFAHEQQSAGWRAADSECDVLFCDCRPSRCIVSLAYPGPARTMARKPPLIRIRGPMLM